MVTNYLWFKSYLFAKRKPFYSTFNLLSHIILDMFEFNSIQNGIFHKPQGDELLMSDEVHLEYILHNISNARDVSSFDNNFFKFINSPLSLQFNYAIIDFTISEFEHQYFIFQTSKKRWPKWLFNIYNSQLFPNGINMEMISQLLDFTEQVRGLYFNKKNTLDYSIRNNPDYIFQIDNIVNTYL